MAARLAECDPPPVTSHPPDQQQKQMFECRTLVLEPGASDTSRRFRGQARETKRGNSCAWRSVVVTRIEKLRTGRCRPGFPSGPPAWNAKAGCEPDSTEREIGRASCRER